MAERIGRREKVRAATLAAIHAAAWAQVRQRGAAQLSLRAVATDVGLSSAGVYRYYASRDDLLTALIAEGFDALATSLQTAAAAGGPATDVLASVCRAYRRWALTHRHEFALLFGDAVPDYRAPVGGPTTAASRRVGQHLIAAYAAAWRDRPPPMELIWPAGGGPVADAVHADRGLPDDLVPSLVAAWGQLHGLVALEAFGHLNWLDGDPEPLFDAAISRLLPPPA